LERLAERGDATSPAISPSWRADWDRLTGLLDSPPAMWRVLYTPNASESLPYSRRKVLKGRGAFPNDAAIVQLLYRGLQPVAKKWTQPIRDWKAARKQFVLLYGDRGPM
jgi:putative transposase